MALPVIEASGNKEVEKVITEIGQAIFKRAKVSVETAAKTVIPSIPEMMKEITDDIRSGPMNRFADGLKKLDDLINGLGVNLEDYSKELAEFLKLRQERQIKSEETVNQLRTQNIIAEINERGDVNILTKRQIVEQEDRLKELNKEIRVSEKELQKLTKTRQEDGKATKARQDTIQKSSDKIVQLEKERQQILTTLNRTEEQPQTIREKFSALVDDYVPDQLRDIGAAFTEGLTAPFTAVKELGMIFGSLLKPLKLLPKLFMTLATGLIAAIAGLLPYILIAGAVVVSIIALKKGFDFLMDNIDTVKEKLGMFADAVMEIPGEIADFFKGIFRTIKNFFIDAVNGVITLVNKIPGVEIEKIEREPDPESDVVPVNPATTDEVQAMRSDDAYIVPKTPEVSGEVEGPSKLDQFKEMLKFLMPQDNGLVPMTETGGATATYIDNSVKSANQNNTTQSASLSTRNDDKTFSRLSMYDI